ncbi:MAG: SLC13 family permease [Sulfolobales archaeon]
MRDKTKLLIILIAIFCVSFVFLKMVYVGADPLGRSIVIVWCSERLEINATDVDGCYLAINDFGVVVEQAIALSAFLFVVVGTALKMEWRVGLAGLAIVTLILSDIVPPKVLVEKAVSWDLILFLVGSMTLAGILRELGVFKHLAIQILRIGKNNSYVLVSLITLISFTTAAVLGEVTSIIYVIMLIFEIARILKIDVVPLIILSVLATNTGSAAMPIGNPIGVYIFFAAKLSMSTFIKYSLPLATINLIILLTLFYTTSKKYMREISNSLKNMRERVDTYLTSYYVTIDAERRKELLLGNLTLLLFILTIMLNDLIANTLTQIFETPVDPHSLLAFIPYIFILITFLTIPVENLPKYIERSVEWSSLIFFIFLFMLSYSLSYTGVMAKLAYIFSTLGREELLIISIMLLASALLSSILDNLSVIVTFTPIALLLTTLRIAPSSIYFALLYGGVFGGNYTPIGSTANIIAVSMAEKRKIRTQWIQWLKTSIPLTTTQLLISLIWVYYLR